MTEPPTRVRVPAERAVPVHGTSSRIASSLREAGAVASMATSPMLWASSRSRFDARRDRRAGERSAASTNAAVRDNSSDSRPGRRRSLRPRFPPGNAA
jgi:hypothetical protein